MLSGTAEYALRAVIRLAGENNEEPVAVRALADELGIPANYLSKIFHTLARDGILDSVRGKGGGFRLAVLPERLSLLRVVAAVNGGYPDTRCVLGRAQCSDRSPCPVHHKWKPVGEEIREFLKGTTVADVM